MKTDKAHALTFLKKKSCPSWFLKMIVMNKRGFSVFGRLKLIVKFENQKFLF